MEPKKPKPMKRLRRERELRCWTLAYVAEKIGAADERVVGRWERGVNKPSMHFRERLCALFGWDLWPPDDDDDPPIPPEKISPIPPRGPVPERIDDPLIPPLPNEGRELVGRQALLDSLAEQLCTARCVVLNGLPGVGKTAMAVALLNHPRVHNTFRNGVLWAGLGPQPNVSGQLSRWGMLLGLPVPEAAAENSLEARADALCVAIGERSMVLVVDDAWEVGAAQAFNVGGGNCAFLVTTRSPDVARQITLNIQPIPELGNEDGLALLKQLAPEAIKYDEHTAQTLVQEVGGLPLAIMLMGKYLHRQGGSSRRLKAAFERLQDATQRLVGIIDQRPRRELPPGWDPGTPLSLLSIIAVSDMQLVKTTRSVFYALSVFPTKPSSFSEEAALAVSQAVPEKLDTLCDVGLLESSGSDRYTLHQTIADYAAIHLTEILPGERFVAYCISFIENHIADYEALALEIHNLLAGLKCAFENHMYTLLVRGVHLFTPFLLARGLYDLAFLHLQRALQIVIWSHNTPVLTTMYLNLGEVKYQQGEYSEAEIEFRQGLKLARDYDYRDLACQLLILLGRVAIQQENLSQALLYLQEGLSLARELDDVQRTCDTLLNLAHIAELQQDKAQLEGYLQEALHLAQQNNLLQVASQVLNKQEELKRRQQ